MVPAPDGLPLACRRAYKYVPYGAVHEVIPYLMRRAQENSDLMGGVHKERLMMREQARVPTGGGGEGGLQTTQTPGPLLSPTDKPKPASGPRAGCFARCVAATPEGVSPEGCPPLPCARRDEIWSR